VAVGLLVNSELYGTWKEAVVIVSKVLSWYLSTHTDENWFPG
jgi:hypothetical protein